MGEIISPDKVTTVLGIAQKGINNALLANRAKSEPIETNDKATEVAVEGKLKMFKMPLLIAKTGNTLVKKLPELAAKLKELCTETKLDEGKKEYSVEAIGTINEEISGAKELPKDIVKGARDKLDGASNADDGAAKDNKLVRTDGKATEDPEKSKPDPKEGKKLETKDNEASKGVLNKFMAKIAGAPQTSTIIL